MKDEKALEQFTDQELFVFINERRERSMIPKIRQQIVIANKMLALIQELKKNKYIKGAEYGKDWNEVRINQLENHVNAFIGDLNNDKKNLLKDVGEYFE